LAGGGFGGQAMDYRKEKIEVYIRDHSEAEFSHGICPDCMKKLYPDEILKNL
jgi:hypothetical protein